MPAMHLKSYESDLPVCRWKQAERNYEVTIVPEDVTCKKCISMSYSLSQIHGSQTKRVKKGPMKIQISVVGEHKGTEIDWPEKFGIPRVDEEISFDGNILFVRHVVYYPDGSESPEPFVYVVVGPRNPR